MRRSAKYTIFNAVTPVAITSSTNATPIVVTATSHGLATGNTVMIQGHLTNTNANGMFKVTSLTANTFSLQDYNTGANVAGNGVGTVGVLVAGPKVILANEFNATYMQVMTSGSANLTLQVLSSGGKLVSDAVGGNQTPNFGATQSKSNPWQYSQLIDLATGVQLPGTTGIVLTGTDIVKAYELNVSGVFFVCPTITAWTAGVITVTLEGFIGY